MIIVETITGGVASRPHWNCSVVSFSRCMWPCVYKQRRVYVPPLFLVSRESMHNPPTMQSTFGLSPSPSLSLSYSVSHSASLSLSLFYPFSLSLSLFRAPDSSLSLKYCRYEQINCARRLIRRPGSTVRKIKRFSG